LHPDRSSSSYVLSIEHTTRLPIRTYIALYLIRPLPYLRTAGTPLSARNSNVTTEVVKLIT
jgi:hypothetical protein